MNSFAKAWLVANEASGSNSPDALDELHACFADHGITIARRICFPQDDLPSPADLERAGIELLAVYTGDGTLNAALSAVRGWSGAVLVLPGGTMNLLSHRLHGEADNRSIIEAVTSRRARRAPISILRCPAGDAYAGCLVGPGTQWGAVREAMRDLDVIDMASSAADAVKESLGGSFVRATSPAVGAREGYPLIEILVQEEGLRLNGYHAESAGEMAQQGWALLKRQFRDGPHDRMGFEPRVTLASIDGAAMDLLLDGEPADAGPSETFTLATSECDLLATRHD